MLLMCLEVLGEELFCFPVRDWEGVCWKLFSLVKLYQRLWDMKYRSEFKHGFTHRGYLHCAILKTLHSFQEKSPQVKGHAIFSSKCSK